MGEKNSLVSAIPRGQRCKETTLRKGGGQKGLRYPHRKGGRNSTMGKEGRQWGKKKRIQKNQTIRKQKLTRKGEIQKTTRRVRIPD